jgi:hypothetical protein
MERFVIIGKDCSFIACGQCEDGINLYKKELGCKV